MKKALMILLGIAMIFSMAGVVTAADDTTLSDTPVNVGQKTDPLKLGSSSGMTEVSYTLMTETYSIYIPHTISFSDKKTNFIKSNVTAEDVSIRGTNILYVNVTSTHGFKMYQHVDANNVEIPESEIVSRGKFIEYAMTYTSPNQESIRVNSSSTNADQPITLMTVNTGTVKLEVPVMFEKETLAPDLGMFKDVLTFTVESKEKA